MAKLRVNRDTKESVWRPLSGRNLMISMRSSRGNSGEIFDGAVMVDGGQWKRLKGSLLSWLCTVICLRVRHHVTIRGQF